MSVTFHPAPEQRLTRLIAREGGLTVAEAVQRADAAVALHAPAYAQGVDGGLAQISAALAAGAPTGPEQLDVIYRAADSIVGLAGPAGLHELGRAAYSLCELVQRFRDGAVFKAAAVQVHLDAMAVFRRPPPDQEAVTRSVMEGLAKVVRSA